MNGLFKQILASLVATSEKSDDSEKNRVLLWVELCPQKIHILKP